MILIDLAETNNFNNIKKTEENCFNNDLSYLRDLPSASLSFLNTLLTF